MTIEARIRSARETVAAAQHELDQAMAELEIVQPPEKTMITDALRTAFDNVAAARAILDGITDKTKTK